MSNETGLVKQTAATPAIGQETLDRARSVGLNLPENAEQMEMIQDLMQAEADLEAIGLPMVNSRDLLNVPLTICDASVKVITDNGESKPCVNFIVERSDTGERVQVLKSSNAFNDVFVNFFNKWRAIQARELQGYHFVESDKFAKAGNKAIILQKIQQVKTVGKGK